ncbi:MAG: FMN-binding protein [Candidatus Latescibacteria bacterium]|nr:FMN-binding protein [Candidatus Latescibacterota bacterium]
MRIYLCVLALGCSGTLSAEEPRPSEEEIGQVQTYLTPEEARRQVFPEAAAFVRQVQPLTPQMKAAAADELGRAFAEDSLEVYIALDQDQGLLGYAVVSEEIGKFRPITFMVGVAPDLSVRGVAVLVFRESRGSEVRRSRFLSQYRGKSPRDPVRLNRDIVNISGATLSVRALNFGVKKVLILLQAMYGPPPTGARR